MQRLLVAFLVGVLIGAAGVLVVQATAGTAAAPSAGMTRPEVEDAIAKALRGVERQMAELRDRTDARAAALPAATRDSEDVATAVPSAQTGDAPTGRPGRARRPDAVRPSREATPPQNLERLRELQDGEGDLELRRRWLFMSESEALTTYGTPNNIRMMENGELRWTYELPVGDTDGDGEVEYDDLTLTFYEGKLIRAED